MFGGRVPGLIGLCVVVAALVAGASGRATASVKTSTSGTLAFETNRGSSFEVYTASADGTSQTNLTNHSGADRFPDWSPDGSKIAFQSGGDGSWQVYAMNADGSDRTQLTTGAGLNQVPAWSPDGSRIAFQSDRDGNEEIYVMNADGSSQTRVTSNTANDNHPAWSPDGSKIAFYTSRDGDSEVYVMNADGTDQTRVTSNPANDGAPAWSPDGSKIAFTSDRAGGNFDVYIMNPDGTAPTRLTTHAADDAQPDWSADGTRLAFMSRRDGNEEIYVMSADGTAQTRLTTNGAWDAAPDWKPEAAPPVTGIFGSDIATTFAGTGFGEYSPLGGGFNGDGIAAPTANISQPMDVEVDAAGNLYIAEQLGNRVRKVAAATGLVSTVAGTGAYSAGGSGDGPATERQIGGVSALALDTAGNLYIAENVESSIVRIRRVEAATGTMTTALDMGPGHYVGDLEVGPDSFLYFTDSGTNRVLKLEPAASAATEVVSAAGGLNNPSGLAFDAAGRLYVADYFGNRVRRIDVSTGTMTPVAGTGDAGGGGDGGAATSAQLNAPSSLAFDTFGNLYVGEWNGCRVRKIAVVSRKISTVAGNTPCGFAGDGGPAIDAQFHTPASLTFDAAGRMYVSDTYNYRIRRVGPATPAPSDTTGPDIVCIQPNASLWYGSNVSVPCTASDGGSGLADAGDVAFSLTTSVAAGTDTATAATGSRTVFDNAGNSSTAGPYVFKIDRKAPVVTLPAAVSVDATSPAGASVSYSATAIDAVDGTVAVTCSPASGSTFPVGSTTVSCAATDAVGNSAGGTFTVTVRGVSAQLANLAQKLLALTTLPPGLKATLTSLVNAALASFDPSKPQQKAAACAALVSFTSAVKSALNLKLLSAEQAAGLIADAARIRAVLAC